MRVIIKSISKNFFANFNSLLSILLFSIVAFIFNIGFLSTPLQLKKNINNVINNYKKWDYTQNFKLNKIKTDIIYNYIFNEDNSENEPSFKNSFNSPIVNLEADVYVYDENNDKKTDSFANLLEKLYKEDKDKNLNIGFKRWFYLYFQNKISKTQNMNFYKNRKIINLDSKTYGFADEIYTPKWFEYLETNFYSLVNIISEDLTNFFNLQTNRQNGVIFENSYQINFEIETSIQNTPINIKIDNLNIGKSDNFVSNLSVERLQKLSNHEILINAKFARERNLKIGDTIKLPFFLDYNFNKTGLGGEYKIVGFGNKLTELVDFNNDFEKSFTIFMSEAGMLEFQHYISYNLNTLRVNNDGIEMTYPSFFHIYLKPRIILNIDTTLDMYKKFLIDNDFRYGITFFKFDYSEYTVFLDLLDIQTIIFSLLGLIVLAFLILFLSLFLKNKIKEIKKPIGLLKAFGYKISFLSMIYAILFFITFIAVALLSYGLSIPLQIFTNELFLNNLTIYVDKINTNHFFLSFFIIVVPFIIGLISFLLAIKQLSTKILKLLSDVPLFGRINYRKKIEKNKTSRREVNLFYLHFSFFRSSLASQFIVPILFLISNIILLIEFCLPSFLIQTVDQISFYTQTDINYKTTIKKDFDWFMTNGKLNFQNSRNYDWQFIDYQKLDEIRTKQNWSLSKEINNYLLETDENAKMKLLFQIDKININHKTINIKMIVDFLKQIIDDYENDVFTNINKQIMKPFYEQIKLDFYPYFLQITKLLKNDGLTTYFTINDIFLKQNLDIPLLSINLNSGNNKFIWENFKLKLLNSENTEIFKSQRLGKNGWNLLKDWSNYQEEGIPIIISNKFAISDNIELGRQIEFHLHDSFDNDIFKLKVVGINKDDNITNNLYVDSELFKTHFFDDSIMDFEVFNEVYSKDKIVDLLNDGFNSKFLNDSINILFLSENEIQDGYIITLKMLMNSKDKFNSLINIPFNSSSFVSFELDRKVVNKNTQSIRKILDVLIFCELGFFLIVICYIINYVIDKRKNDIILLKSCGYFKSEIFYLVLSSYLISTIIILILSNILILPIIRAFTSIINSFVAYDLVFNLTLFDVIPPIIIGAISVFIVSFIGWRNIDKTQILVLNN